MLCGQRGVFFFIHSFKFSPSAVRCMGKYEKMAARNQTKDLKCATHLLSDKFRNMTEEKKAIVRDLGFGGLMHIPPLRVHHQLLRELKNNFKLGENRLETGYGSFKITPRKIGHALGIHATKLDELLRKNVDKSAVEGVPIQVFVPPSQTTTVPELQETPESDFEPTPLPQIEGTTETTWHFRITQIGNSYHRKRIRNSGWKTTRIFAPVCYSGRWWLWLIDTTKWRCHILDPLNKKAPGEKRKKLNKFTGYVFSRLRAYAGGEPLQKGEKEKEIKSSYVKISDQKLSYDCAIYIMKWMELIEPENIKKEKYEWDNWPQISL
ncbi:hypothetical protein Ahy_A06g029181 isoform B [Arachis hypogaea]|uniref:Ubiquitin-like protease family profile domain-containing protein n=1 Tax=Arachis hypogaea TaxID=3818 RepID=A0A445CSQ9_ARAHY|nr:hypothetical protein Ahy_A06g029181 isoform B [Arachis hypogaea]